ncbi:hypothetical protein ACPA5B_11545 [Pseudomonas solani]|uniref:hypothetical protein n=1 Tax=Pseudomonas solani TaxID=2731552 RepID=UPI003C2E7B70
MIIYEGQATLTHPGKHGEVQGVFQRLTRIVLEQTEPGFYDITCNADLSQADDVVVTVPTGQVYEGKVVLRAGKKSTIATKSKLWFQRIQGVRHE